MYRNYQSSDRNYWWAVPCMPEPEVAECEHRVHQEAMQHEITEFGRRRIESCADVVREQQVIESSSSEPDQIRRVEGEGKRPVLRTKSEGTQGEVRSVG